MAEGRPPAIITEQAYAAAAFVDMLSTLLVGTHRSDTDPARYEQAYLRLAAGEQKRILQAVGTVINFLDWATPPE